MSFPPQSANTALQSGSCPGCRCSLCSRHHLPRPSRLAQSAGGCGCSGSSAAAAARGEQAAAAAADHQLNGMMDSMERGLSRDEIMDAWEASGPRQASRLALSLGCKPAVVLRQPGCSLLLTAAAAADHSRAAGHAPNAWQPRHTCCLFTYFQPPQVHPEGAGERFLDVAAILRSRQAFMHSCTHKRL